LGHAMPLVYLYQCNMIHKCALCLRGDTQNILEIKERLRYVLPTDSPRKQL